MPKKDDILLKSIFEDTFPDLLRFFFSDADSIFNLEQEIEFLDKELSELFPDPEKNGGGRFVDILAKINTRDGDIRWILVHTEIQSARDKHFGERMFQYFYRIYDRFKMPVTALAVFTGRADCISEREFCYDFMGTTLRYAFNAYHIFEHSQEELLSMKNRFALVTLAAQKVAGSAKTSVQQLAEQRLFIATSMIESGRYSDKEIHRFLYFLKRFVYIKDKEINRIFDKTITKITKSTDNMGLGIIETVEWLIREEGREEGKREVIVNLIRQTDFTAEKIASIVNADLSFVLEVRKDLGV